MINALRPTASGDHAPAQSAEEALRYHGGNLAAARRLFPTAPEPWIDLSTGINPLAYPIGAIPTTAWTRLPQASEMAALEATARTAYGATAEPQIVAAPGTQAIIQWLPRLVAARRVGILGPTYGEHEKSWRGAGANVIAATTPAELASCDVGVVVNPNNPDGRLLPPDTLASTARAMAGNGGLLVVDEAFADVIGPHASLVPALPAAGAVVLRSLGKTYGLGGIRLGFAIAPADLAARLRLALGPWAVSGPAIEIGCRALADQAWLAETIRRLVLDARRLDGMLVAAGMTVLGGTPLFRLAACPDAEACFLKLCHAGILTRPFPAARTLRFGIPYHPADWVRLQQILLPGG